MAQLSRMISMSCRAAQVCCTASCTRAPWRRAWPRSTQVRRHLDRPPSYPHNLTASVQRSLSPRSTSCFPPCPVLSSSHPRWCTRYGRGCAARCGDGLLTQPADAHHARPLSDGGSALGLHGVVCIYDDEDGNVMKAAEGERWTAVLLPLQRYKSLSPSSPQRPSSFERRHSTEATRALYTTPVALCHSARAQPTHVQRDAPSLRPPLPPPYPLWPRLALRTLCPSVSVWFAAARAAASSRP